MGSDSIDEADLGLAAAVQLQRAGRWDLALAALPVEPVGRAADLRAEILVDRHLWRLDAVDEAEAAIAVVEAGGNLALAGLLRGQLLYWRMLFSLGPAPDGARRAATEPLAQSNRTLMLSRWWIRRIASPNSGATDTTSSLDGSLDACGSTVLVTNSRSIGLSCRTSRLRWVSTPWLTAA
jgi:hypothetical protein